MELSLLINMKMPTIVGIFIFISREIFMLSYVQQERIRNFGNLRFISRKNFMLNWVKHEKCFITSGPACVFAPSDQPSQGILLVAKVKFFCRRTPIRVFARRKLGVQAYIIYNKVISKGSHLACRYGLWVQYTGAEGSPLILNKPGNITRGR